MKHKLLTLLAAFGLLFTTALPTSSSAVTLLNGQNHYYSVQLRSDKQAIVYGKIVFQASDSAQNTISLRLPEGVDVANLSSQQVIAKANPGQCKEYETFQQWQERQPTLSPSTSYRSSSSYDNTKRCITFYDGTGYDEDYDHNENTRSSNSYFSPYYYIQRDTTTFEYQDIDIKRDGQTLEFKLPTPIQPNKQGSLIVSYTTSDFIKGNFGYYSYAFRTLISDSLIESTSVGVDFDDDLYSTQADQTRTSESISSSDIATTQGMALSDDQSLNNARRDIGKGGRYIQTQGKMLPGDTLEVTGVFATHPVLLMGKEIGIAIVVILTTILLVLWRRQYLRKHPREATRAADEGAQGSNRSIWKWLPDNGASTPSLVTIAKSSTIQIIGTVAGIAVVTAIFSSGLDYYSSSDITGLMSVVLYMVSVGAIAIFGLIVIPGINALRNGLDHAYIWALIHVITIVSVFLALWALLMLFNGSGYDRPYEL